MKCVELSRDDCTNQWLFLIMIIVIGVVILCVFFLFLTLLKAGSNESGEKRLFTLLLRAVLLLQP